MIVWNRTAPIVALVCPWGGGGHGSVVAERSRWQQPDYRQDDARTARPWTANCQEINQDETPSHDNVWLGLSAV